MSTIHFQHIRTARSVRHQSPHPIYKVGAVVCGITATGGYFSAAHHNYWPTLLENTIGRDTKLGNASTTIHAEIAAIYNAPATQNADLYVTELACPNCTKSVVESGIQRVYIDAYTRKTKLGTKIYPYFENTSIPILTAAGVAAFEVDPEQETITALIPQRVEMEQDNYSSYRIKLLTGLTDMQEAVFARELARYATQHAFAACLARNVQGQTFFLYARADLTRGMTTAAAEESRFAQDKYRPTLEPLNRLLMQAARYGLTIDRDYLYSSHVPSSREFVNIIGAGFHHLKIGDLTQSRDEYGLQCLEQLSHIPAFTIET